MAKPIQLSDEVIRDLYVIHRQSATQIAALARCSPQGINHRLSKLGIQKRTISEAIYCRSNPHGDPFRECAPVTLADWKLFGLGLGLYWGEGTKAGREVTRLCNSDPRLLLAFMKFMDRFFECAPHKIKVQLHVFSDMDIAQALSFWSERLALGMEHFYKPVSIPAGSVGTYRQRSRFGTATISYNNVKLKALVLSALEDLASEFGSPEELRVPK